MRSVPIWSLCVTMCLAAPALAADVKANQTGGRTGRTAARALVVSDLGTGYAETVARMNAHGWTVTSITALDLLEKNGSDLRTQQDVVWLLPGSDYDKIRLFAAENGPLPAFVQSGGIVIQLGLGGSAHKLDAAPGGLDSEFIANPGATTISEPTHPFIAGSQIGGTDLTASDLDPAGTGGAGRLLNPPVGASEVMIAMNPQGCNLCEYQLGTGRVFASQLPLSAEACQTNLILYVDSVRPSK